MDIIFSTRNRSKAEQVQKIFSDSGFCIRTLTEAGIAGSVVEDGTTLEENAFLKARFAYVGAGSKVWTIADDTGLFINALCGEPGIYAARWAGEHSSTEETMRHCLRRMEGISDRSAVFRTAAVLIEPDGDSRVFIGEVAGRLLEAPRVSPQPDMPYSALFVPNGQELSWAEMTTEQENTLSHRGQAFRKALLHLTECFALV